MFLSHFLQKFHYNSKNLFFTSCIQERFVAFLYENYGFFVRFYFVISIDKREKIEYDVSKANIFKVLLLICYLYKKVNIPNQEVIP